MAGGQAEAQQGDRIEISPRKPGILHVVAPHGHGHASLLELADRGLGPQGRGAALVFAKQPQVGGGQGHHPHRRVGHRLRQTATGPIGQQGHAAGVTAGERHHDAVPQQQVAHQGHAPAMLLSTLIDVQIHPAAEALRQPQQGQQRRAVGRAGAEGGAEHAAQQTATGGHPGGEGLTLRCAPVPHRHKGHQLQLHPAPPVAAKLQQHLPAGGGPGAEAVDVAADRPQPVAPGSLQGLLAPLPHPVGLPLGRFPAVRRHGPGHGAVGIGEGFSAEGLVEVGMGLHQRRERQGQGGAASAQPMDGTDPPGGLLQLHRHQPLGIGGRQPGHGIQQGPGKAHRRQQAGRRWRVAHGIGLPGALSPAETSTKWPAIARVTAS